MRLHDCLWGLLILLFGGADVWHAGTFPPMPGQNVGPSLFPRLIGGGLVVGGLLLIRKRPGGAPPAHWIQFDDWVHRPRAVLDFILVIGTLVFYALAVNALGFFVTAWLVLATLFTAFGVRLRWVAPLAAVVTAGLHVGFYTLLRVPLPWGWLEEFAW